MDPLLIDVPERIETERLVLRTPMRGDGALVNDAVRLSLAELSPWLPWAGTMPSVDESEAHCRRQQARFILREDFVLLIFVRQPDGSEGELVGGTGLHRIDWSLRRFEIGYWRKTGCEGRGFLTEAVRAVARLAFDVLGARRVGSAWTTTTPAGVSPSAPRSGDPALRTATPRGEPRSARIYARFTAPRSRWGRPARDPAAARHGLCAASVGDAFRARSDRRRR
jgi:RimJ/RimL family protein N-acetyltransferase